MVAAKDNVSCVLFWDSDFSFIYFFILFIFFFLAKRTAQDFLFNKTLAEFRGVNELCVPTLYVKRPERTLFGWLK